ncbi:YihY/virulence factor BrkB family protein [Azonexus sp. IMCC34839]|uniref:YihY/virulence factor BrkB family protein n=1 Tax=Azonexus sp. IMCC34839 TaxID=3133695 RepID=UPI00399C048E
MPSISPSRPLTSAFHLLTQTLGSFQRNQCLLLAGAIAYYGLLSVIPLLVLSALAVAHFVEPAVFLQAAGPFLEWLAPSQSAALLADIAGVLERRGTLSLVLLGTMLFFSAMAFSAVDKAMSVIFAHRAEANRRHTLVSLILPYGFVCLLGLALLVLTGISLWLQGAEYGAALLAQLGHGIGPFGLYLCGVLAEVVILGLIYLLMPVGRTRFSHALVGGAVAAVCWEVARHVLLWYFTSISRAGVVYGSLTTAVVSMLGMEIAAIVLLLGAQAIAEYEKQGLSSIP